MGVQNPIKCAEAKGSEGFIAGLAAGAGFATGGAGPSWCSA